MAKRKFDQPMDDLERRFQALQDQAARLPQNGGDGLQTAFQEVSEAIAALRASRDAEMRLAAAIPRRQEAQSRPKSNSLWPLGPTACPDRCETILSHLFLGIPDLFNVLDRDFTILMSNWHAPGESVPEAARRGQPKCHQLFWGRDRPCEECQVREAFDTGQPQRVKKHNPIDGRTLEINAFPLLNESGEVILVAEHVRDITERHRAEEALREGEARFRTLIEDCPESMFLTDVQGTILAASRVAAQRLGKDLAEITGTCAFDQFPREVAAGRRSYFEQAIAARRPVRFEDARGDIHFDINIHPILDAHGQVSLLSILALDITERKRAEEALKESQERFRAIFETAEDCIFIKDRSFRYIQVNPAMERLFDCSAADLIGLTDPDLFGAEVAAPIREQDQRVLGGEKVKNVYTVPIRGVPATFHSVKAPLRDAAGTIVGICGIVRDITDLKQAEDALTAHLQFLQLLLDTIPSPIFFKDAEGAYLGCNRAFENFLGVNRAEIVGKSVYDLSPRELADEYHRMDLEVFQTSGIQIYESRVQAADGTKHDVVFHKATFLDPTGNIGGLVGIITDITDLQRAKRALRESEATWRTLIEAHPEALVLMDTQGMVLAASQAAARRLGKDLAEIIGADLHAMFSPEVGRKRRAVFQRVVDTGQPARFEDVSEGIYHDNYLTPIFADNQVIQVAVLALDITARKQTEEALRESEARFRAIFELAPVGICIVNLKGRFLQTNRAFQATVGYTAEELRGMDFVEITHPEDLEVNLQLQQELLAGTRQYYSLEKRYLHKDGGINWVNLTVTSLRNVQGQLQYLIAAVIDITARKQAEEALKESEERYRTLFETSPDALIVMDLDMNLIMGNQRGVQMIGHDSPEQAISRKVINDFALEDRPRVMAAIKALRATGRTQTFETTMVKQDGTRFPSLNSAALIRDAAGNPHAILGVARDITEIKQAEAELRESEQKLRLMAETIQDAFWIVTAGIEKMVYVSPAYEQIWGRSCAELYQSPRSFIEGIHPEDREPLLSEMAAGEAQGVPWGCEYRIIKPDGAVRWVQDRGFPVRDDQGRIIMFTGVATDITERKALEEQLLQAQKMEAVGRLAGGVAHDFNNLLMAIMGYSELMRAKVHQDDPLYDHLENILKAGERASALTQQLLTFSRRQIIHPQVMDLKQVVLDLEPMLRRLLEEDIELEIISDPKPVAVNGDPGQMSQIIMNLVVNARDAMPRGGRLSLKTAPVDFPMGCRTRLGLTPPGAYVALEVRDTGVGMDEATLAHIFEPFFTTKEPGKGTGLGLSTVYGIVKQSGGYLDLDSEPGQGSTFTVLLPRLKEKVKPSKVKMPITESLRGEETILLVEDEDVLRALLARFLRLYGYAVLEARHGGEALLICERHQGPIHLMVTDVVMPQMSGRELADRLSPLRPDMQVLYMSGYTDDAMVHYGVADLSVPFLQKPFKPIELVRQVHEVLHPQGHP